MLQTQLHCCILSQGQNVPILKVASRMPSHIWINDWLELVIFRQLSARQIDHWHDAASLCMNASAACSQRTQNVL